MQNKFPLCRLIFPQKWFWFGANEAANLNKDYTKAAPPWIWQLASETDALVSFAGKTKYSTFAAEKFLGAPHLPGTRADLPLDSPGESLHGLLAFS